VDPSTTATLLERLRRVLAPQYTIDRELASGGMGVVFVGTDVVLDRRVAIKVLRPDLTSRSGGQRFTREARLLARLQHPNIVAVHQAGEAEGVRYFVMDYIDGRTLAARLTEGPLNPDAVTTLGRELLSALEAAHHAGVIHRDVKPANVFLVGQRALLGDFGIARAGDTDDPGDTALTGSGQLIGTPAYMSPEQLRGAEASPRTDVYCVGLVLYEACTGKRWPPVSDPDRGDWRRVPPALRRALRKALAISPESRWQNAAAFRHALGRRFVPLLVPTALAAVAALLIVSIVGPCPGAPVPPGTDFAIVPFGGAGGDDAVGERLARYVGNELEWFPGWRLTSVPASFAWWTSAAPEQRALKAPAALRARFYAEGELRDGYRTLQVSIRDSTGAPYYRLTVAGAQSDLLAWGSATADSIVRVVFPQYLDEFRELAARGSRNVQAYTELFAGQEAFRQDAWGDAQRHFQRALELDPEFAQAAWQLELVRRWRNREFETDWRRFYQQHREQLPQLQRLLIAAQLEPDLPTRFTALQAAVRQYPRSSDGALLEADELFHHGPLAGIPLDSAVRVWEAAARRNPYFTAYQHIAVGGIKLGHRSDAQRALKELERNHDASSAEAHQRARLVALEYDARFRPWLGRLKLLLLGWRADSAVIAGLAQYARLGLVFDVPQAQRRVGEILTRGGTTAAIRANGHEAQGIALMAEGRPTAALGQLDSAAALFGTPTAQLERAEWRLLPAALGLPAADSASAAWARSTLGAASGGPHAVRAAWALAVDAITTGDAAALSRWRERLEAAGRDIPSARRLSRLVDGLAAGRAGDAAGALATTDSLLTQDAATLAQAPFARAMLYLHRGEWLAATGAAQQADRAWLWYEAWDIEGWATGGVQAGEVDAVAGVFARLRRAELAKQRGDSAAACPHVMRVRQLWAEAEPAYARLRRRADSVAAGCPG